MLQHIGAPENFGESVRFDGCRQGLCYHDDLLMGQ